MKLGAETPAVITGGASGLGAATARALAALGVKCALFDLNEEKGRALAREIGGVFARCDVTDEESVSAAFSVARRAHGQERLFLGAAGIGDKGGTLRRNREGGHRLVDLAAFRRMSDVNVHGLYLTAATSAAGMAQADPLDTDDTRGAVVVVSSVAGSEGPIGMIAYAASKGAVIGMSRSMAHDLSGFGIRVNCIQPAFFETPLVHEGIDADARRFAEHFYAHPRRLGRPEEFASLALELFRNDFLNGQTIKIDAASGRMSRLP